MENNFIVEIQTLLMEAEEHTSWTFDYIEQLVQTAVDEWIEENNPFPDYDDED